MTKEKDTLDTSGSGSKHGLDLDDPVVLHLNDLSCISIVSFKLQGTSNYKSWASATELGLRARNKLGFVTGAFPRPTENEVAIRHWDRADAVVLSWLLGSISESLYHSHVLAKTSSEVWSDLKETYEKLCNTPNFCHF